MFLTFCSLAICGGKAYAGDTEDFMQELLAKSHSLISENRDSNKGYNFYIFISFAMGDHNLKQVFEMADIYGAIPVLRGLKDNSFSQTAIEIKKLGEKGGVIIDPNLFEEYNVTMVPTFVLAREKDCLEGMSCYKKFDKLAGNVKAGYVLDKIIQSGSLSNEARDAKSKVGNKK
jgi:type-F conjugative transfer system pilin assembly protein TrbC